MLSTTTGRMIRPGALLAACASVLAIGVAPAAAAVP